MVVKMDVGQYKDRSSDRPGLILRRAGDDTLWEIAKATGTTVAAILQVNGLQQEPEPKQMLLIPIQ